MKKPLKERLKFWHLHCLNCGNKLEEVKKGGTLEKDFICGDCGDKILVRIGIDIPFHILYGKSVILIECSFLMK